MQTARERVSFFAEQARHRRSARRWSLAWGAAAVTMGAPLSALLTPLVFLLAVLAVRAADLLAPVPEALYAALHRLVLLLPRALAAIDSDAATLRRVGELAPGLAILLLPGLAAVALLWLAVRALLLRDGGDAVQLALGARPPRLDDAEERQLVHAVEEMALAAGAPPPRVLLIDRPDANAAIIGTSPADATLVIHRGTLDRLGRDETQAVLAHLVAAVATGELALSVSALAVYQTIGLLLAAGDALCTFSPAAWRELARVVRWAVPGGREVPAAEVAEMLAGDPLRLRRDGLFPASDAASDPATASTAWQRALERWPVLHGLLLPLLPFYLYLFFLRAEVAFLRYLLVDPLVQRVLRARCYLADAGAVQLTRYPDALARALTGLAAAAEPPPGDGRLDHLFVIAPATTPGGGERSRRLGGPHPPLAKRLERLRAMGAGAPAEVAAAATVRSRRRRGGRAGWGLTLLLVPLLLLAAYLLAFVVAIFTAVAVGGALLVALLGIWAVDRLLL